MTEIQFKICHKNECDFWTYVQNLDVIRHFLPPLHSHFCFLWDFIFTPWLNLEPRKHGHQS